MATYRELAPGQRSRIMIGGPAVDGPVLIMETDAMLVEAPNWTLDGTSLLVNGNGRLFRVDLDSPGLVEIVFEGLPEINNDHVLDPDGDHVFASAMDGHVYRGALTGGPVQRVTPDDGRWHFLHGVSPDGTRLAYVELASAHEPGRLAVLDLGTGSVRRIEVGSGHLDGPEWSGDGAWIYLNTEAFTDAPGHAQLARLAVGDDDDDDDDSGDVERLVVSDTVDWFPHLSPDGRWASYVAFPAGTRGHPADLAVDVRVVSTDDWSAPVQRYPVPGGQGTLNVNSWSPDGERFAFVAYPFS